MSGGGGGGGGGGKRGVLEVEGSGVAGRDDDSSGSGSGEEGVGWRGGNTEMA